MTLDFVLDPPVDRHLRDGVLDLWADVTNAGGAVGFVPPVTPDDIRPQWVSHLNAMDEGRMRLLAGYDADGAVAATAFVTFNTHRLMNHWVWLYTVMVHPKYHGMGHGRALLAAAEDAVRGMDGMEAIRLTCRGGLGLERFYASCGYKEVGRVPDAIRLGDDEYRDDIVMLLPLK
ncbi:MULTISPECIES: GNAT family N-acetyltransferase [Streptomyces]|uniref:Acetyltransferase n=2 Tax=Streptomyces TaxID=1883 RepID=A0A100Y241_9ACTN|nr:MULTISPECIES: GNAT family N-acetyltransferase [Streptomyces]KUH36234.1 acetyltransferase [Streptomyces kanasensis]UUS32403.1 GNAT family N-acetyltransferase [Streptomyces changanensis]